MGSGGRPVGEGSTLICHSTAREGQRIIIKTKINNISKNQTPEVLAAAKIDVKVLTRERDKQTDRQTQTEGQTQRQ